MESYGYMFIEGEYQGEIETDLDKEGREGGIPIYQFQHKIGSFSLDGIRREGVPVHGLIRVTKEVDKTTPKIMKALCTVEPLKEVVFKWFSMDDSGVPRLVFSVLLESARISGVELDNQDVRESEHFRVSEHLDIYYQKIRWEFGMNQDSFFDFDTTLSISYLNKAGSGPDIAHF